MSITQDKFDKFVATVLEMERHMRIGSKDTMPMLTMSKNDKIILAVIGDIGERSPMDVVKPLVEKTEAEMYFFASEAWAANMEAVTSARETNPDLAIKDMPVQKRKEVLVANAGSMVGHKFFKVFKIIRSASGEITELEEIKEITKVSSDKLPGMSTLPKVVQCKECNAQLFMSDALTHLETVHPEQHKSALKLICTVGESLGFSQEQIETTLMRAFNKMRNDGT